MRPRLVLSWLLAAALTATPAAASAAEVPDELSAGLCVERIVLASRVGGAPAMLIAMADTNCLATLAAGATQLNAIYQECVVRQPPNEACAHLDVDGISRLVGMFQAQAAAPTTYTPVSDFLDSFGEPLERVNVSIFAGALGGEAGRNARHIKRVLAATDPHPCYQDLYDASRQLQEDLEALADAPRKQQARAERKAEKQFGLVRDLYVSLLDTTTCH